MKILVIEDDKEKILFISQALLENGHTTDLATNGEDGIFLGLNHSYDVIIIDRMLPKIDGLTIIKQLRGKNILTPILILSALNSVDNRVMGLKSGADDYLTKPFAISELIARVNALSRRTQYQAREILEYKDLKLDNSTRTVFRNDTEIHLQPQEFKLLECLMQNSENVVTRSMLLEKVWNYHFDPQTNVIDVHISRLRSKIDKDYSIPLIHTVRGAGYVLKEK